MKNPRVGTATLLVLQFFFGDVALAQLLSDIRSNPLSGTDFSGAPVPGGLGNGIALGSGMTLKAALGVGGFYDSNVFFQRRNEQSAFGVDIRPTTEFSYDTGPNRYELYYSGRGAAYSGQSEQNFFDSVITGKAKLRPALRHRFDFEAGYLWSHDPLGLQQTEGLPDPERFLDSPDRWQAPRFGADYRFGAPGATGNLAVWYEYTNKEYQNRRDRTRYLDFSTNVLGGGFYYKFRPKTTLDFEVINTNKLYPDTQLGLPSRSSVETRGLVGATWEATAKTTGRALVGYVRKDFKDSRRNDYNNIDWDINMTWSPRTYSRLVFATRQRTTESYEVDTNFILNRDLTLDWLHDWNSRINSRVGFWYTRATYEGNFLGRKDDIYIFRLAGDYDLGSHYALSGGVRFSDRTSNIESVEYDKYVVFIGISGRL